MRYNWACTDVQRLRKRNNLFSAKCRLVSIHPFNIETLLLVWLCTEEKLLQTHGNYRPSHVKEDPWKNCMQQAAQLWHCSWAKGTFDWGPAGDNIFIVSFVVPLLCGDHDRQLLFCLVLPRATLFTAAVAWGYSWVYGPSRFSTQKYCKRYKTGVKDERPYSLFDFFFLIHVVQLLKWVTF